MPLRFRLGQVLTACCVAGVTLACTRPVVPVASPAGGPPAPAPSRPAPGAGGADFESLLRQIGRAADGEALTAGYLDRGAPALLAAASAILDQGRDEVRDRGARLVLMSLRPTLTVQTPSEALTPKGILDLRRVEPQKA